MMSNWEIPTGVFVDTFRRDEFNISFTEESIDAGEQTWYCSAAAVNIEAGKASGETSADFLSDGSVVCVDQGASNEIWYFPSDEVEHYHEVGVDSQDTNEHGLVPTEEQIDENEEDAMSALDNLAALLGEPPRKKSVWDNFDLIVKNQPLAEYMEESEIMRSGIRKEPIFPGSISRTNSKRKSQKKPRCDFSNEDAPKMVKTMSKSRSVIKKPDLRSEIQQKEFQSTSYAEKEQASSINCLPNNNAGDNIAHSDTSMRIRALTANQCNNNNVGTNFKDKVIQLPNGIRFTVVKPPPKVTQSFGVIKPTPRVPSKVASTESIRASYLITELPTAPEPVIQAGVSMMRQEFL